MMAVHTASHEMKRKVANMNTYREFRKHLVERELKDADLDALFHARLIELCKASLPQLALVTRERPKQAQKG